MAPSCFDEKAVTPSIYAKSKRNHIPDQALGKSSGKRLSLWVVRVES